MNLIDEIELENNRETFAEVAKILTGHIPDMSYEHALTIEDHIWLFSLERVLRRTCPTLLKEIIIREYEEQRKFSQRKRRFTKNPPKG